MIRWIDIVEQGKGVPGFRRVFPDCCAYCVSFRFSTVSSNPDSTCSLHELTFGYGVEGISHAHAAVCDDFEKREIIGGDR